MPQNQNVREDVAESYNMNIFKKCGQYTGRESSQTTFTL